MSRSGEGEKKSQHSRKSLVRRITAHQIGGQISLMLFLNAAVLAALLFFITAGLFATSAALLSINAGGATRVYNVLYDEYELEKDIASPRGLRVINPATAIFNAPDGAYFDMEIIPRSDINPFHRWADVHTIISLPNGAGLFDGVRFSHNTLFFILFRALAVFLLIQAFIIIRGAFHIRNRTRQTLRPIMELTLAAQSINAAQAGTVKMGAVSPYGANRKTASAASAASAGAGSAAANTEFKPHAAGQERTARNETTLKISGAIDTLNTITERHLDRRISIDDERVELKGLASAINGMLDRLDAAYQAQLRFVSDASHELRTPISVIQGYANLLDRWGKNDETTLQESIDAIKNEAESMKELVEQLLFLARGDTHSISFSMEDVDISSLIEEVAREAKMIDETHEYQSKPGEKLIIRGDYQLLKQALRILIDNSVKFTPPGGRIAIGASRSRNREGYLDIVVRDSGAGISEEALPHIFDRFYKADESRSRSVGGAGLGLSIAKWIVSSHNGIIEVVSSKDAGARFTLSFPESPDSSEISDEPESAKAYAE